MSFLALSHCSITMEKAESSTLPSPDTHCAFCQHVLRSSDRWRPVASEEGLYYIGGQISFLDAPKFMEPKFACDRCFASNLAKVKVRISLVTTHYHIFLAQPLCKILCVLYYISPFCLYLLSDRCV
jgi:hypothetical protein